MITVFRATSGDIASTTLPIATCSEKWVSEPTAWWIIDHSRRGQTAGHALSAGGQMDDDFDLVGAMLAIAVCAVLLVAGQQFLLKNPEIIDAIYSLSTERGGQ